jgi:hypothetical protein
MEGNMPKYPDYIMQKLRQRRGLEPYNTSQDADINLMSKHEAFGGCLEWEGIIGYEYAITYWIQDIYGIVLQE